MCKEGGTWMPVFTMCVYATKTKEEERKIARQRMDVYSSNALSGSLFHDSLSHASLFPPHSFALPLCHGSLPYCNLNLHDSISLFIPIFLSLSLSVLIPLSCLPSFLCPLFSLFSFINLLFLWVRGTIPHSIFHPNKISGLFLLLLG